MVSYSLATASAFPRLAQTRRLTRSRNSFSTLWLVLAGIFGKMFFFHHTKGDFHMKIAAGLDVVNTGLWFFTMSVAVVRFLRARSRRQDGGEGFYGNKEGEAPY